jgi:hypothetical protein
VATAQQLGVSAVGLAKIPRRAADCTLPLTLAESRAEAAEEPRDVHIKEIGMSGLFYFVFSPAVAGNYGKTLMLFQLARFGPGCAGHASGVTQCIYCKIQ